MGETLFAFDRQNFHECQAKYRGDREQEYYRGDFWIEDASRIEVHSERKTVGPISIIRQRSASNLFFRRTRQHIREDATDLSILWFAKYGQITFSNQFGSSAVPPGGFAVTQSMSPIFIECQVDGDAIHEVLHVTIPTHVLRQYAPCDSHAPLLVTEKRPELTIAEKILTDIFDYDGGVADEIARLLADTALTLIGTAIRGAEFRPARQTITERRQQEVLRYIEVHLTNPTLSAKMVAQGCGISPRYLSSLLQVKGTSFSELVWQQRLQKAKQSLGNGELRGSTIAEICYDLGFKSPAHFSRLFKRVFKVNPSDYREDCQEAEALSHLLAGNQPSILLQ